MLRLLPLLLGLLGLKTINAIYSYRCPIVETVQLTCRNGIFHQCKTNSACSGNRICCPSTRDGGCALRCLIPRRVEGCPSPMDFALLVDTSGSISRRNFRQLLKFIEDMVDAFDISEDGTHIALVEYSTKASVQMKFNDFSGAQINSANYKRKIRKVPHARGYTYIDKALEKANEEVFTEEGGMRENVTKVALVMTDGRQTVNDESVLGVDILEEAVKPIKDKGVLVMTIGIGKGANLVDLLAMASSDVDVYMAENFKELRNLVKDLTVKKCPVNGGWSEWNDWSVCPVTCGGGTEIQVRHCTNPRPQHGGLPCQGSGVQSRSCNEDPCPVDGFWADWRDWEPCSVMCGGGSQNRSRTCTNPPPAHGGKRCTGEGEEFRSCNESPCPVDGNWTEWDDWGVCTVTCGGGTQSRLRTCTNPSPKHGGKDCDGRPKENQSCNEQPCPIDGNWTDWGDWDTCSLTCGGGTQSRSRTCTNPPPAHGGKECSGKEEMFRSCSEDPCPVDGNWTEWDDWQACTVTCGGGTRKRFRTCTNPPPQYGGKDCHGRAEDVGSCNEQPCPIDGNWTDWGDWDTCSLTCGVGTQSRSRTCTNPPPAHGGKECTGKEKMLRSCSEDPCPVDGNWTEWVDWGVCTVTCGGGTRSRLRTCTNPAPNYGGKDCVGKAEDNRSCNEQHCPIDGNWTDWEDWDICSLTCGGGTQSRSRTCTNPPPAYGGKECTGKEGMFRSCSEDPCPGDGKWADWDSWIACSRTCGGGTQSRSRTCTNPPPKHGGKDCDGSAEESRFCNEQPCPIDGNWTEWRAWSPCSVTCGDGILNRSRTCTNPPPAYGGAHCPGPDAEIRRCEDRPCPVDGKWSTWENWSLCSATCNGGTQDRRRSCTNPAPAHGGAECLGGSEEARPCNENPCPVDGNWTEWRAWSPCSVSCGDGIQNRSRTCTNPPPAYGGAHCPGPDAEIRRCDDRPCPVDGKWSAWENWSLCSATCNGGTQGRRRSCTNPAPAHGGAECLGGSEEARPCNENPCPVNGNWSAWGNWTECTVTCGGGMKTHFRTCTNPAPAFGGAQCPGESQGTQACNERPCPGDGNWSAWKDWSACSVSCAGGTQRRSRTCTNPPPTHGGRECLGDDAEARSCNEDPCPIDGNWTKWSAWDVCPVSCGGGIQSQSRTCTNPSPTYGGAECTGDSRKVRSCNEDPCPVDGNWSEWKAWASCSLSCGGGTKRRTRDCNNPLPAHGGRGCPGESAEIRPCNDIPCPVDGDWARWTNWRRCTLTCGGGTQDRSRTCTNPPPAHGGRECPGDGIQSRSCNEAPCPVDGNWSPWSLWNRCPVTCGSGEQRRYRTCSNPAPAFNGANCVGQSSQYYICERRDCPVDGNWTEWNSWSRCSASCGVGKKRRLRSCTNPPPSPGGRPCLGDRMETNSCIGRSLCAVHGQWGQWSSWGNCFPRCGAVGKRTKSRKCDNPPPSKTGRKCYGRDMTFEYCPFIPCSVSCTIPVDLAILVDTSGSISKRNFGRLLRFIQDIVRGFTISEEGTHIALIEYSNIATIQLNFNDLRGRRRTVNNVVDRVKAIPHQRGRTFIDKALHLADRKVFVASAGMRNEVKKVALVMTDGEQTVLDPNSSANEILEVASKPLKDKGIHIIALGIGRRANKSNLGVIASEGGVYSAVNFRELRSVISQLKKGTCPVHSAGYIG